MIKTDMRMKTKRQTPKCFLHVIFVIAAWSCESTKYQHKVASKMNNELNNICDLNDNIRIKCARLYKSYLGSIR